jgi:5'-3' exonuclease
MDKYSKMLLLSIKKIIGNNIFEKSKIYFCTDSEKNIWRSKIYLKYKEERVDLSIVNNFKPVFEITFQKIISTLINDDQKINLLLFDNLEADDIIASICMSKHTKKYMIYIVSNDDDYIQLGNTNIFFVLLNKKKPIKITKIQAKERLLLKIIKGDKSDNIKSIFNGLNIPLKTRKLVISNNNELIKFLKKNKNINDNYLMNKKIIDFKYIPQIYQKKIIDQFILTLQ